MRDPQIKPLLQMRSRPLLFYFFLQSYHLLLLKLGSEFSPSLVVSLGPPARAESLQQPPPLALAAGFIQSCLLTASFRHFICSVHPQSNNELIKLSSHEPHNSPHGESSSIPLRIYHRIPPGASSSRGQAAAELGREAFAPSPRIRMADQLLLCSTSPAAAACAWLRRWTSDPLGSSSVPPPLDLPLARADEDFQARARRWGCGTHMPSLRSPPFHCRPSPQAACRRDCTSSASVVDDGDDASTVRSRVPFDLNLPVLLDDDPHHGYKGKATPSDPCTCHPGKAPKFHH
ncbi:hypothetical protein HU200_057946 [Digitaria exilis]|uniref:Uncharacterized protein n=1 Tax=Digitaria exilis TaxID=1010633 RepID=A0A835AEH7_9POAL|nr:hypothetical protein HU200_057946 [Digitaria exilis]